MKKVFIKGLGLIGSSLIRAIRMAHPDYELIGSDISLETREYAINNYLVDRVVDEFDGASEADFIILASPVSVILKDLEQLSRMELKENVLITDVGSTKMTICVTAQKLFKNKKVDFIAGHPMAGSHKTGIQAGKFNLFENAYYFQIPLSIHAQSRLEELEDLLVATNAKWVQVSEKQHDRIVAQISHIPHIIASGLVNQTEFTFQDEPLGMRLAAGGFKSITRIASADPTMWTSILLNNPEFILKQLEEFEIQLAEVKENIKERNYDKIFSFFNNAKISRDKLNSQKVGVEFNHYDLFLNIPDKIGGLAHVTKLLADAKVSLVNIQILEVREEIDGVLQLTFSNETDKQKAKNILKDYEIINHD